MKRQFRDSLLDSLAEAGFTESKAKELQQSITDAAIAFFKRPENARKRSTRIFTALPLYEAEIYGIASFEVKVWKSWFIL